MNNHYLQLLKNKVNIFLRIRISKKIMKLQKKIIFINSEESYRKSLFDEKEEKLKKSKLYLDASDQEKANLIDELNLTKSTFFKKLDLDIKHKVEKINEKIAGFKTKHILLNSKFDGALQYEKQEIESKLSTKESLDEMTIKQLEDKKEILDKRLEFKNQKDLHLSLSNLTMSFGGLKAVDKLSFDVKKGEIFGLIGPNGAGKTTVFNCITQFYKPSFGDIYYRDENDKVSSLISYKVHDIINLGIVRTFQNVELVWELTVLDNLLVGAHSLYNSGFFSQLLHLPKFKYEEKVLKNKAYDILAKLDLLAYKDMIPYGLPYGILKKIELARTLMTNPKLIILDEPAAGLNDSETKDLAKLIREIRDKFNLTIFLVEHDMELVMDICDTICAISFGKKLAIGTPSEIQTSKLVQEAYLGGE